MSGYPTREEIAAMLCGRIIDADWHEAPDSDEKDNWLADADAILALFPLRWDADLLEGLGA